MPPSLLRPAMYDHSRRSLEDLLRQGLLHQLIERYERNRKTVLLTVDGHVLALSLLHTHHFLCGMLWSTRPD
jgi:hypothetical protein